MKTKNSKFSRILVILMIVALMIPAFGSAAYAEGETANSGPMRTPASYLISFNETSTYQALADVYVSCSGLASSITSKITLQSAPLGSSAYSNVTGVLPSTKTVYNTSCITHICTFPISPAKNYRIKIVVTDVVNGKEATATFYKNLTR